MLSRITNFAWLARISTGRRPILGGLLPPLGTLIALLGVAAVIASGLWVGTAIWAGAMSQATAFLPLLSEAMIGVLGLAFVNFWFNRSINTAMLSSREIRSKSVFAEEEKNPTDVRKMVKHLRKELNVYFKNKEGRQHRSLPKIRLATFTDNHFKIVNVEGRSPENAALFFSSGVFHYHETRMNQRQLAALIQMELVKIYMRRGFSRTLVGMACDLLTNLQNLAERDLFSKVIWFLTMPLQFFLLIARSVSRSYEYEAALVVVECGRGMDLIDGIDRKVCPTLDQKGTYAELKKDQARKKRAPYTGWFSSVLRPITDWIDNHEYAGDAKKGNRLFSLADILVQEGIFYIRELWATEPRSTRLKDELRQHIRANTGKKQISLEIAKTKDLPALYRRDKQINQEFCKRIAPYQQYEPITPRGNGFRSPILSAFGHRHHHRAEVEDVAQQGARRQHRHR